MAPRCCVCMLAEPPQPEVSAFCLWIVWRFTRTALSKYMAPPLRRNPFPPRRRESELRATGTNPLPHRCTTERKYDRHETNANTRRHSTVHQIELGFGAHS